MSVSGFSSVFDHVALLGLFVIEKLRQIFLSPAGTFSLASLLSALCIALLYLHWQRRGHTRPVKARVLLRAVFPRRLWASRSGRADIGFFLFNSFLAGLLFSWAILSAHVVSRTVNGGLTGGFGALSPTVLPEWLCALILTLAVFLAYELGYWLDHYLSHRIPFLWEFHKVHHTAESLSPLTNFRVHPVDSLVFVNILALVMGATGGTMNYLFGKSITSFSLFNVNALVLVFTYLLDHLHHTHFWIPFTGVCGRIFVSPAHHQIHHSTDPRHFNKNMGSCLAIYDWLFGTLQIPSKERERLTFGVTPEACQQPDTPKLSDPHTITEGLIAPVGRALAHLVPAGFKGEARPVVATVEVQR